MRISSINTTSLKIHKNLKNNKSGVFSNIYRKEITNSNLNNVYMGNDIVSFSKKQDKNIEYYIRYIPGRGSHQFSIYDIQDFEKLSPDEYEGAKELFYIPSRDPEQLTAFNIIEIAKELSTEQIKRLKDNGIFDFALGKNKSKYNLEEPQYEVCEILEIGKFTEKEFQRAIDNNMFDFYPERVQYQMSSSAIKHLVDTDENTFNKVKQLFYIKERKTSQFSDDEISELCSLNDKRFEYAKKLFYIPQRKDMQFSGNFIYKVARLESEKAERLDSLIYIQGRKDKQLDEESILYLLNLNDAQYERAKELLYIPERKNNQFRVYDIEQLIKLNDEQYEKAKKFFYIPERKNNQLDSSAIVDICEYDEKKYKLAEKLLYIPDRKDFQLTGGEIKILIMLLTDEDWEKIKERGLLKYIPERGNCQFKYDDILNLASLPDEKFEIAKQRNLIPIIKRRGYNQFYGYDICKFANLSDKEFERVKKYFYIPKLKSNDQLDRETIILLAKYEDYNSVKDMSASERRAFLNDVISKNKSLFDINYDAIGYSSILPKNEKEYCEILPLVAESIGLTTKPLTNRIKEDFNNVLKEIEQENSRFRHFDFENPDFHINLSYPKKDFINDVKNVLSGLSYYEQREIELYFGFEIHETENGMVLKDYPVDSEKTSDIDIKDERLLKKIDEIKPLVKKYSEENTITIENEPELTEQLNKIIKALPEFITEIDRKQNNVHDYSLDVHSLKVLQNVLNNPEFMSLNDEEKKILKITALLHDITKAEYVVDSVHAVMSAFDVYYILSKFDMNEDEKLQIYQLIKSHEWLKEYNQKSLAAYEQQKTAQNTAFNLRKSNTFKMAAILTKADMMAIKRGGDFFKSLEKAYNKGIADVGKYVNMLKKSAIHLPQTKIPKAGEIKIDGINTFRTTSSSVSGKPITNTYLFLRPNIDLSQYGFEQGLNSDDVNILVHGLYSEKDSSIFQTLDKIDSDAVLSTSYICNKEERNNTFRPQGFIIYADSDDIHVSYYRDFGSGYEKNIEGLSENFLFNPDNSELRNYFSDIVKEKLHINNEEYIDLYNKIKNKSITYLDEKYPNIAKIYREIAHQNRLKQSISSSYYDEVLVTKPKIQGVFVNEDFDLSYAEQISEFLRIYAEKNDVPIICLKNN